MRLLVHYIRFQGESGKHYIDFYRISQKDTTKEREVAKLKSLELNK